MSQPNTRSEGSPPRPGARGNIATKSREAAERVETSVADGVERVRNQADDAKERAAERLRRVATQLENVGEGLRAEDAVVGKLAERASRGIGRVADYVSVTDGPTLIRDTEQLARQKPALFFGGAFLVGLAAGRFLRSSRPEGAPRERQRFDDGHRDAQPRYYGADPPRRAIANGLSSGKTEDERPAGVTPERNRPSDAGRDSSAEQRAASPNTPRGGVAMGGPAPGANPTASERNPPEPVKGRDS